MIRLLVELVNYIVRAKPFAAPLKAVSNGHCASMYDEIWRLQAAGAARLYHAASNRT
jgi:hypothetical protein